MGIALGEGGQQRGRLSRCAPKEFHLANGLVSDTVTALARQIALLEGDKENESPSCGNEGVVFVWVGRNSAFNRPFAPKEVRTVRSRRIQCLSTKFSDNPFWKRD